MAALSFALSSFLGVLVETSFERYSMLNNLSRDALEEQTGPVRLKFCLKLLLLSSRLDEALKISVTAWGRVGVSEASRFALRLFERSKPGRLA